MNNNVNHSIKCSVTNCANHCGDKAYCALNEISVGCKSHSVATCGDTECASFAPGEGCCR
ncbi:MAG: DUF1540 domain-containing protein [Oscillospiraceae bacterium]